MKSLPLCGRFLLWMAASLALSVWVLVFLAPRQLGIGLEVFLSGAVRERLQTLGESMADDVGPALGEHWKVGLRRYDLQHGVRFCIYDSDLVELAGEEPLLPAEVAELARLARALMQSEAPPGAAPPLARREAGAPLELPPWPRPSRRLLLRSSFVVQPGRTGPYWIGIRVPILGADGGLIPATILARADGLLPALRFLSFRGWLGFAGLLVGLTVLLWAPLLWGILHALSRIKRATQALAEEQFDSRVELKRTDELGQLAEVVNTVAARLAGFVRGQKEFLANITHEVTSPIARLQMGIEALRHHLALPGQKTFQDVQEEVQLLTEIASELLAFSRAGMAHARSRSAQVSLRALVLAVLERENARGGVVVTMPGDLTLRVNPASLGRAIGNLVRNALRYAGTQNGPIEVVAEPLDRSVCIRVMDRGPGVPRLSLINLGEPFYRPELARKRSTGGLGLGLATVRNCVAACGGTIAFRNRKGGGFEAEILVPHSEASGI
jgi:two-component system sensor histidine kinase CpxA